MAEDVLISGKKLSELKVTELKSELDKRGLQKAGVKSVLMDRLRRAVLREENSDLAAVNDEGDEINVEELSDGENNGEREDSGEQSSAKKTPKSLRNTPGGDRTGSADPAAEDEGSDPEAEAPVPPLEVTMETNEPANDSEQHKARGPGRPRKQQFSKDASLVETPRSGSKDESRSPSQQASERSDQEINSQETGEKVKRGPGRPRKNKNPLKDSPLPAAPKSAVKATDSSKKVVGSARRKSAPPTKMPIVKVETSSDTALSHPGGETRQAASKPSAKAETNEGPAAASVVAQPRSRQQEVDFKKDVVSGEFAEKAGESEDNQEDVVDDEGLLDQREEAPVPEYDLDRSAKAILDVPMEIASPIESEEEELLLDTSDEFGGKRGKVEREGVSGHGAKLTEKDSDDTRGQVQEPDDTVHTENGQKQGHSSHSLDRNESISSVQIDPSYQPDTEELLYEGDVETEARLAKVESARDEEGEGDTRDDCFVFDVTGDNMELDEHPSEKPKKDGGHKAEAAEASGQDSTAPSSTPAQSNATEGLSEQERPLQQCNLWLSGLASTVSALDLQTLFSTVGQVISAKVVARAQSKHHRFGYVTMATPEQAALCITKLNDTELKGRRITVELSKTSQPSSLGHRGDKQPQDALQGGQSSGQSHGVEGGEKAVQASPSTEAGSKSASSSKRLMVVDKGDGKKILRVNRRESQQDLSSRLPRGHSRERRKSSPHQRPPPIVRKGSPRRPRSPPGGGRVVSRLEPRKGGEPPRRLSGQPPYRQVEHRGSMNVRLEERRLADDRRQEMLVRRQLEIEHSRREQEMLRRMQETHEREARERVIRERELAEIERRFQERERELREKEARERQRREVLERELRERDARERDLRDKERRLRELREQHEKELREREIKLQRDMEREKEVRERAQAEKERQLKEQERKLREEKEKLEKERLERERRERERRAEEERRLREEQRQREERAKEEQKEQERRQKEEKERLERERVERERREHAEQEQKKRAGAGGREQKEQPLPQTVRQQSKPIVQAQTTPQSQRSSQQPVPQTQRPSSSSQPTSQTQRPPSQPTPPQRTSQPPSQTQRPPQAPPPQSQRPPPPQQRNSVKRPFADSDGYDSSLKRPALHDVRSDNSSYSGGSSSVFNRLEPASASGDRGGGMIPPMRPDSGSTGYPQQQHLSGDLSYRLGQSAQAGGSGYPLPQTHGGMMEASKGIYPASYGGGGKAHMTQEQLYAVSEAMESLRNSSYSQAGRLPQGYMPVPGVGQMMGMNYHRSNVVPDMPPSHSSSIGRQQMMSSGGMSKHKLPPEDERYNKRLSRPPGPPPPGRQSASFNKRLA